VAYNGGIGYAGSGILKARANSATGESCLPYESPQLSARFSFSALGASAFNDYASGGAINYTTGSRASIHDINTNTLTTTQEAEGTGAVPKRQGSISHVFSKFIDGKSSGTMFSKLKGPHTSTGHVAEGNPILQFFELGELSGSAGPENVWKIYNANRKSDLFVSTL